jgi:hypothetical protein
LLDAQKKVDEAEKGNKGASAPKAFNLANIQQQNKGIGVDESRLFLLKS